MKRIVWAVVVVVLGLAGARAEGTNRTDKTAGTDKAKLPLEQLAAEKETGFYADTFLSLRTPDFDKGTWGYGIGVGYQVTRYWGGDVRLGHRGLDAEGSAVQDIGGRLIARMPWETLQPYTFVGSRFDLEENDWHLEPGLGIAIGKRVQWFAEAGIDANLRGESGYKFGSGFRFRFGK